MSELGTKYTCYSCQTKFYDFNKPEPICPKCEADQREAGDESAAPKKKSTRKKKTTKKKAEKVEEETSSEEE